VNATENEAGGVEVRGKFRRQMRLEHDVEFKAVFDARVKKAGGGLVVFARPNGLKAARLGLSVGKGAGGAVERNRVKRLIREAFRGMQHEVPRLGESSYDLIVGARTARGMTLAGVRASLRELIAGVHGVYEKRARREREA
jgi:ribonuclease P protein component